MFALPSLFWIGLPLVALPLLIHLINMVRHRRVKWAAMEFILQSQKKHRKWIMLKQLLLLLLRTAAVASIVLMLAQPILRNQWSRLFGGSQTHHVLLLDDSYSMSDRWGDTSAFGEAKKVIRNIAKSAAQAGSGQTISLLRFSESEKLSTGAQPDWFQEALSDSAIESLDDRLNELVPSQTSAGPVPAIEALKRLPRKSADENRVLYIVSDFRSKEWENVTEIRSLLEQLNQSETQIHLVRCVDEHRPNLAITHLEPMSGTLSAGVEMLVRVSVKNFGDSVARQVAVRLEEDGHERAGIVIDSIESHETASHVFRINYPSAGAHTLVARLDSDAVLTDNSRYFAVDLPPAVPVLLIDGSPESRDAYFLASALSPGGTANTGLKPQIEEPSFLRKRDQVDSFSAIYLLNLERLDESEIETLEEYVRSGGGVAFFLGELSRGKFFNEHLYREGSGLFPAPITVPTELLVDRLEKAPDLEVSDHPIFSVFAGTRNSFLSTVMISRYFGVPKGWAPPADSTTRVIARLRNGAPLVLEKRFGDGRVIAQLTKVSPEPTSLGDWTNWSRNNPTFVVTMLELQGYLTANKGSTETRLVGQPLEIRLDNRQNAPKVEFVGPSDNPWIAPPIDEVTTTNGLRATLADTGTSGVYEAVLTASDGAQQRLAFAYNVESEEGNLETYDHEQLRSRLKGIDVDIHRAEDLQFDADQLAGFNLSDSLLYLLLAVLIGEQILAYSASYHLSKQRRGGR